MAVELQVEKAIGGVANIRIPRVDRLGVIQVFTCMRGTHARPQGGMNLYDSETSVVDLIKLHFVVAAHDNAWDIFLSSHSLVVLERTKRTMWCGIFLRMRLLVINMVVILLFVLVLLLGSIEWVDYLVFAECDMVERWNGRRCLRWLIKCRVKRLQFACKLLVISGVAFISVCCDFVLLCFVIWFAKVLLKCLL